MSRQLKFRCYDTLQKKWLFGYEYPNLGGFSLIGEVVLFGELNEPRLDDWDHIDIMQFTGLQDKNGKEIYEGDIVTHKYRRIWQTNMHTSKVIWNPNYCCFYLFDGTSNHRMRDDNIFEIIGNIHENPEIKIAV